VSRKINSKKELPKSFDLKKYFSLESMSDKDLFRQLYWRSEDLDKIDTEIPDFGLQVASEYPINNNLGDPFGEIKESEWFLEKQKEYECKSQPDLINMSYGDGITPLSRLNVSLINTLKSENGYWKGKPIIANDEMIRDLFSEDNGMFWAVMREPVNLLTDSLDNLMVTIDLNNRDEVLIEALSNLLPLWRNELKIPEPSKPVAGGWGSIRRKILEYKIIPLIDLLSWANSTKSKISNGVLSVALFPDGEKDSFIIAQTINPFLEKLMAIDSLDKIRKELSKEA
jgi:hypothetical protein